MNPLMYNSWRCSSVIVCKLGAKVNQSHQSGKQHINTHGQILYNNTQYRICKDPDTNGCQYNKYISNHIYNIRNYLMDSNFFLEIVTHLPSLFCITVRLFLRKWLKNGVFSSQKNLPERFFFIIKLFSRREVIFYI